ncbi:hypothetical protein ACQ1PL_09850 [Ornithobacterium rhinotracheale]
MKNSKKSLTKLPVSLLLSFLILFPSCYREDYENFEGPTSHNLTDKEVFKGVMFMEGPISDKINSPYKLNDFVDNNKEIEEVHKFQDKLINSIIKTDPSFLSKFRKDIGSGDYYVVSNAIERASTLIRIKSIEIMNIEKEEYKILEKKAFELANNVDLSKNKISKSDILSSINEDDGYENSSLYRKPPPPYSSTTKEESMVQVWIAAYGVVAVAVVAVIAAVVFAYEDPVNPADKTNKFMEEDLKSDITLNLKGI